MKDILLSGGKDWNRQTIYKRVCMCVYVYRFHGTIFYTLKECISCPIRNAIHVCNTHYKRNRLHA